MRARARLVFLYIDTVLLLVYLLLSSFDLLADVIIGCSLIIS